MAIMESISCCRDGGGGVGSGIDGVPIHHHSPRRTDTSLDDAFLVQELNELSVKERDDLYGEIHGVSSRLEPESIEFKQRCLQDLLSEFPYIPKAKRKAYERAVFLKPTLVQDASFFLMFLRATRYNTHQAAKRICSYFTNKLELFGDDNLVKRLTLGDLSPSDLDFGKTGAVDVLPNKDQAGRTVILKDIHCMRYKEKENFVRFTWYQVMNIVYEDESIQFNGCVDVLYGVDPPPKAGTIATELIGAGASVLSDLPVRMVGIHYVYNDPLTHPAMKMFQILVGRQNRLRFRSHYVSRMEAQYVLLTFGILMPEERIHSDEPYLGRLAEKYIAQRRLIESEQREREEVLQLSPGVCALYPLQNDVLLGRGKPFHSFPGNRDMLNVLEGYREQFYNSSQYMEKTLITMTILRTIQERGGRFLQRTSDGWVQVDDETARSKITQAFRQKNKHKEETAEAHDMTFYMHSQPKRIRLA